MEESKKRKASPSEASSQTKKNKTKQWYSKSKFQKQYTTIDPGDIGIWATCARGKEGKSTIDLRDVFDSYAAKLYPGAVTADPDERSEEDDQDDDIEASITAEVSAMRGASKSTSNAGESTSLFQPVKLDTPCVLFFKTRHPIEPVSFVESICRDKANGVPLIGCKFVKRLTPMLRMEKATEQGLETLCRSLLTEETLGSRDEGTKYAIRPTIREHNILKRDALIKQTASAVGHGYGVDLKNPDKIILVEVYRNILGIAVVSNEFSRLKNFNLAEIHPITALEGSESKRIQTKVEDDVTENTSTQASPERVNT